jgi:ADP-ribose pyrophosphatase
MKSLPTGEWRTLASECLLDRPHLQVFEERIGTPSRPSGVSWTVVRRKKAVVVAPRLANGNFVLVRQERAAIRSLTWEFPAGQIDGEPTPAHIEQTLHRELKEEAGGICRGQVLPMGHFFSSAGFTDEQAFLFLATEVELVPRKAPAEEGEMIVDVVERTPTQLAAMITSGEIFDANTLSLYARLHAGGYL